MGDGVSRHDCRRTSLNSFFCLFPGLPTDRAPDRGVDVTGTGNADQGLRRRGRDPGPDPDRERSRGPGLRKKRREI